MDKFSTTVYSNSLVTEVNSGRIASLECKIITCLWSPTWVCLLHVYLCVLAGRFEESVAVFINLHLLLALTMLKRKEVACITANVCNTWTWIDYRNNRINECSLYICSTYDTAYYIHKHVHIASLLSIDYSSNSCVCTCTCS